MTDWFIRVEAPHFVAALIIRDGTVVASAPILNWTLGKTQEEVLSYFKRKNYTVTECVM